MRLFKREIGITHMDYMNYKRIFSSLPDLKDNNNSILNISLKYGFYSQEYYCEMFHKIIGVSPSTYRKFIHFDRSLSFDEIYIIQENVVSLNQLFKKIELYQKNLPPKDNVIQLSIFK